MSTPDDETTLCYSTASLELGLLAAYAQLNTVAETAAIDQIRAHLTPSDTRHDRATALALASVLVAAGELRDVVGARGCQPRRWEINSYPGSHRHDQAAQVVAAFALNAELNIPGSGETFIAGFLDGAERDTAVGLVVEAAWLFTIIRHSRTAR